MEVRKSLTTRNLKERLSLIKNEQWLKWAVELQDIAQGGLFYGKDKFDI
ncbi:NUDIX hydrolase N-terminal domain-containing protein, partial [Blautia schinkii]